MHLVLILLLTMLAAGFGTVTGFGTSTIMVPLLAFWYPLPEVLFFAGIIHWFGDIWKMYFFKKGVNWRIIFFFGLTGIIASYIGASLPISVNSILIEKLLAIFLVLNTLYIWFKPRWKLHASDKNALLGGIFSGFTAGMFGVGGPMRGAFLSAFNLKKEVYIFTSGAVALLIDSARILRYYQGGVTYVNFTLTLIVLSVIASFIGADLAKRFVTKIPQKKFRYIVGLGLLFAAVMLFVGF